MTKPDEYDVVIVGAGISGLVAAIAAARADLNAIVLERSNLIGGCGSWAYSATWVANNHLAVARDCQDSTEAARAYLDFVGGGENNSARTLAFLKRAPDMLRILQEEGVQFSLLSDVADMLMDGAPGAASGGRMMELVSSPGANLKEERARLRTPPGNVWRVPISQLTSRAPEEIAGLVGNAIANDMLGQGASLVAQLLTSVRDHQVEVRTESEVTELHVQDRRVVGVRLRNGTSVSARRGVILSTGSYLADARLVSIFEALPNYGSIFPSFCDGNGLELGARAGASIGIRRTNLSLIFGYDNPDRPDEPLAIASVHELPRAHVIMVNKAGNRFGNEAAFQNYSLAIRAYDARARRLINLPAWMVFDAEYVARWGFAGSEPGTVPGWVSRAATLAGLAAMLGIDASQLPATVARFNEYAEAGVDADFHRRPSWGMTPGSGSGKNASLGAIAKPPFYAVKLRPSVEVPGSGLRTDEYARVVGWGGESIKGLFAAGDVALHDELGTGYQAGLSLSTAMTFAIIAIDNLKSTLSVPSEHESRREA